MEKNYKKFSKHSAKSMKGGDSETVVVSDNSKYANIEPVMLKPLEVVVYNNGFDKALRAFRALVQKERILSSYKEKQVYLKPSDRKRQKRKDMKRKMYQLDTVKEKPVRKRKPTETVE